MSLFAPAASTKAAGKQPATPAQPAEKPPPEKRASAPAVQEPAAKRAKKPVSSALAEPLPPGGGAPGSIAAKLAKMEDRIGKLTPPELTERRRLAAAVALARAVPCDLVRGKPDENSLMPDDRSDFDRVSDLFYNLGKKNGAPP